VLPGFQHTVCLELAAAAILISDCLSIFKSILFVQSSIYRTPIRLAASASKVRPYTALKKCDYYYYKTLSGYDPEGVLKLEK